MNKVGTVTKNNTESMVIDLFMYSLIRFVMTLEIQSAEKLSDVDGITLKKLALRKLKERSPLQQGIILGAEQALMYPILYLSLT